MKKGSLRTYIAAGSVALVLTSGAILYSFFVTKTSADIEKTVQSIEAAVQKEDYKEANEQLSALLSWLNEKETALGATINHNDIYSLRLAMGELSARLTSEEQSECMVCINNIKVRTKQLEQSSVPSLFNIL